MVLYSLRSASSRSFSRLARVSVLAALVVLAAACGDNPAAAGTDDVAADDSAGGGDVTDQDAPGTDAGDTTTKNDGFADADARDTEYDGDVQDVGKDADDADAQTSDTDTIGPDADANDDADGNNVDGDSCASDKACDDGNPCTDDKCVSGTCSHPNNTASCDDGTVCTVKDACSGGKCVAGAALDCSDGKVCTTDACDAVKGCTHADNTAACEDGNVCTGGDVCANGVCTTGTAPGCDDGNECTADTCDTTTGCSHSPVESGSCDDGNKCTSGDKCAVGLCTSDGTVTCEDNNACTADGCDPKLGCVHQNLDGLTCDDGQNCSSNDACLHGICQGTSAGCVDTNVCTDDTCTDAAGCVFLPNAVTCDDGLLCTDSDACSGKECVGTDKNCDDKNACTIDTCDANSACVHENSTSNCDDGNACTSGDACAVSLCVGATADCDDLNGCTVDSCDKISGCVHAKIADSGCADGDACTANDKCVSGVCTAGAQLGCDDANVCTADSCKSDIGCVHDPLPGTCDDGNACTSGDSCDNTLCVSGPNAVTCTDDTICTDDSCNPEKGCVFADNDGALCDDGQACSANDACLHGACLGSTANCADSNPCTDDTCKDGVGCVHLANAVTCDDASACTLSDVCTSTVCTGIAPDCDDKNPCTTDGCDLATGCTYTTLDSVPCEDGNLCTSGDTCVSGVCKNSPTNCDDNNVCTADSCEAGSGCVHTHVTGDCSDGNACTDKDACDQGKCVSGAATNCEDNEICTTDSCNTETGCVHDTNDLGCDDANKCTTVDTCAGGTCGGSTPLDCDDKNPCTTDSCAALTGCVHENLVKTTCDDGQVCSINDVCNDGVCSGSVNGCSDGNPCTNDTCVDGAGCSNPANTAACDDGNACTTGDVCAGTQCVGGGATNCDDGEACTSDACDPSAGCFHTNLDGVCTDGNPCTGGDACAGGKCVSAGATDCDDLNQCTTDSCSTASGCVHAATDGATCNDGSACTTSDTCVGTVCKGTDKVCDDGNPCTIDSCLAASGCTTAPGQDGAPCTDGNACTQSDTCANGSCAGSSPVVCIASDNCHSVGTCDTTSGSCSNPAKDNGTACDDASKCTTGDVCTGGTCGGTTISCDDGNVCTTDSCAAASGCVHAGSGPAVSLTAQSTATAWVHSYGGIEFDGNGSIYQTSGVGTGAGIRKYTYDAVANTVVLALEDVTQPRSGLEISNGHIYTLERAPDNTGNLVEVNPNTLATTVLFSTGLSDHLGDVTVDSDGNFWVSQGNTGMIKKFQPNGTLLGTFTQFNYSVAGIDYYNGKIYGTKYGVPGELFALDLNGNTVLSVPVNYGSDVEVDANGLVWLSNGIAQTTVYDANLNLLSAPVTGLAETFAVGGKLYGVGFNKKIQVFAISSTACDDGLKCTISDSCAGAACKGQGVDCDDKNACTIDSCDPDTGACVHNAASNGTTCNDGNACTQTDTCTSGTCGGGNPVVCPSADQCNNASVCSPSTGTCSANPKSDGTACNDGNACSQTDVCASGVCTGGNPVICTAQNSCRDIGTCNTTTGVCSNPAKGDGTPCSDGSACTQTDTCQAGTCQGGNNVICPSADQCHVAGTCDPANGTCSSQTTKPDATGCNDGSACTTGDVCTGGLCAGTNTCNDGIACTTDACDVNTGCSHTAVNSACDDGNVCTSVDTCTVGTGCTHTNATNTTVCDDTNPCTSTDKCNGSGTCVGSLIGCNDNNACTADSCNTSNGQCVHTAGQCVTGAACTADSDCVSGDGCASLAISGAINTCQPTCTDGKKDGTETGIDCGLSSGCGLCVGGRQCVANSDCMNSSNTAVTLICDTAAATPLCQPHLNWAFSFATANGQIGSGLGIAHDSSDNVIPVGDFYGQAVDFDPSATSHTLNSHSNTQSHPDGVFASYSSTSAWIVDVGTGASGEDMYTRAVTTDSSGNIYVCGNFGGTVDMDPSGTTHNLTDTDGDSIFVAKYSSAGAYVWAYMLTGGSGSNNDNCTSIAIDKAGTSLFLAGRVRSNGNFDPAQAGGNAKTGGQNYNVWLAKWSISGATPVYAWSNLFYSNSQTNANAVALDSGGNPYLVGLMGSSFDADPSGTTHTLTVVGTTDAFIASYTAAGAWVWAYNFGNNGQTLVNPVLTVGSGDKLNFAVGVPTANNIDFDPSATTHNNASIGMVLVQYTSAGVWSWQDTITSAATITPGGITTDSAGNIVVVGAFNSATNDFDSSGYSRTLTRVGNTDAFVAVYSSSGAYRWANSFGGANADSAFGVSVDSAGRVLTTGNFTNATVDFDPTNATVNLTSAATNGSGWVASFAGP